jgi:hypothetical protein
MWSLERKTAANGDPNGPRAVSLILVRRRPARAVTLSAVVGGLLSLVPLVIAPDPGPLRLLAFALLAVSSGALVVLGRTRPERVELTLGPGGLTWGDEPLPPPATVTLAGDGTEEPPLYVALVGWADGRARVALEGAEPGPVLADALELARYLGLELRPGWGLEGHFPEALGPAWESALSEPPDGGRAKTGSVDLPLWPAQRRVAGTTLVAGVFVLVSTAVFIESPERTIGPSALELALPFLAASFVIALGAVFWGMRRRIELSASGLDAGLVLFGVPFGKPARLGPAFACAFAVAPDDGPIRHVLFATASGPLSVVADPEGAGRIVSRAERQMASERAQADLPLATSARYRGPDRPARLRS